MNIHILISVSLQKRGEYIGRENDPQEDRNKHILSSHPPCLQSKRHRATPSCCSILGSE